jgi:tetratricopeptide (TPR) repeat protein
MTAPTRMPHGREDCARAFALATGLQRLGKLGEADQLYRRILAVEPNHFGALCGLGSVRCRQDQLDVAMGLFRRAAVVGGPSAEAPLSIARMLAALNHPREAVVFCRAALAFAPDHAEAHFVLANALCVLERRDEAIVHYAGTLAARPDDVAAHKNLGDALQALGRFEEAIGAYRAAIAGDPEHADAHNNLGNALAALGRPEEAIGHYRKALALRPGHAGVHGNAGGVLRLMGRLDEAAAHYRQAVAAAPGYAEARCNLGSVLHALGRSAEAIVHYEKAVALRPDFADAQHGLGIALGAVGRLAEAQGALGAAVRLAPGRADFHLALAQAAPFTLGDPRLADLEDLAHDMAALPEEQQVALHFALGKAFADLAEPERSFRHLVDGNALKRRRVVYDEAASLERIVRIHAVFTAELMREGRAGDPSSIPVFVVGMPCSGAALIEQILAGHPAVHGAGEREDFGRIIAGLAEPGGPAFPDVVPTLPGAAFAQIASSYLGIRAAAPRAQRIVDRMPANFLHVGLIHLALPNARIIHARRDPVDTCLSCFSSLFADDSAYSYDLGELGRYHAAYQALMAHWRDVLPQGVMLEVNGEDVAADVEGQARRLVAHCGLDWDESCLAVEQTVVHGARADQERQSVYRTLVGRKLAYADVLAPLIAALGPRAVA